MNIGIGKVIRDLRKEQNITQEKLAEYLGISYQAVSKWENGTALPDITLIPTIASFFGVTTDTLFQMDEKMKNEKIKEYEDLYNKIMVTGNVNGRITLMRKALVEYPRNYQFMLNLAFSLTEHNGTDEQVKVSKEKGYVDEVLILCERIIEDCTEDVIRHGAIQILCNIYPLFDKTDKAIKLANQMPAIVNSRENLLAMIYRGKYKIKQTQENTIVSIDLAATNLIKLSFDRQMGSELTAKEKIRFVEAANKLYEALFSDSNYLFYNKLFAWNYRRIAELQCSMGERVEAVKSLEKALYCAKEFDSLPDKAQYTSIFLSACEYEKENTNKNWIGTESDMLYHRLNESVFDSIRELPEFKRVLLLLEGSNKIL
jgi:transcriptional regulator with XRE-family HTH domain